jgi:hypothetical protein
VNREKHVEKIAVRQDGRVERDAHDLGVARAPAADVVVRGIRVAASGVAGIDRFHTGELVEYRLEAPEAASAEHGDFAGGDGVPKGVR